MSAKACNTWVSDAPGCSRYQPHFLLIVHRRIDLLPRLFGKVFVPDAVHKELCHPAAPTVVREWAARLPVWVEATPLKLLTMPHSGRWERGSAPLLRSRCPLHGDLILIDERKGANVALAKGSKSPAHSASAAWPQAWPCAPIQARATPFG